MECCPFTKVPDIWTNIPDSDLWTKVHTDNERYVREKECLMSCGLNSCPQMVEIVEFRDEDASIVMKKHSSDLFERVAVVTLPPKTVRQIALDVVHAIEHMKSHGWAHRDVKLENVLLTKDDRGVLCDFDSSRQLEDIDSWKDSEFGMTVGYMPPELYYSQATDVWQIGVMIYSMLTSMAIPIRDFPKVAAQGRIDMSLARIRVDLHEELSHPGFINLLSQIFVRVENRIDMSQLKATLENF